MNHYQQQWLDELRHGGHRRGYGQLATLRPDGRYGFCCLGVAAHHVLGETLTTIKGTKLLSHVDPNHLALFNLTRDDEDRLAILHDRGAPFNTVADVLERVFTAGGTVTEAARNLSPAPAHQPPT